MAGCLCHEKIKYRIPPITNIFDPFSLINLAKIIERDSKDPTYKFALLRGTSIKVVFKTNRINHI
jgi:hypothetical protein